MPLLPIEFQVEQTFSYCLRLLVDYGVLRSTPSSYLSRARLLASRLLLVVVA